MDERWAAHMVEEGIPAAATAAVGADGKEKAAFRDYSEGANPEIDRIKTHYADMRRFQTVDYVRRQIAFHGAFDHQRMTVREAFDALSTFVDASDPDTELPQLQHALQTAESIRAAGQPGWFQLVGLIHDLGKVMFLWGADEDGQDGSPGGQQWALGGDTWVVGCPIPDTVVFPELSALSPDAADPRYGGGGGGGGGGGVSVSSGENNGMYEAGCGMENLVYAWGHDEFMYRCLVHNGCPFPPEALAMVRYHSCYPWHNKGSYARFEAAGDAALKEHVLEFNKYDLYTKCVTQVDVEAVWPHYQALIDKYMPGKLAF